MLRARPATLTREGRDTLWLLLALTLIVYVDRDAYVDHAGGDGVSFLDALYYATVTMTTTGSG